MTPITCYTEERHPFGIESDKLPPKPPPGIMWVFEQEGRVVAVDFLCPCGCGSKCYTPVHEPGYPALRSHEWDYSAGPTLSPSIRYLGGCKAHFNITNGNVIIHGDSGK